MKKGYVWFSYGSDKSGPALAEAVGFESGKKTPNPEEFENIIGWGCKAGSKYERSQFRKAIASGKLRVLNSVEAVEANRNKFESLAKMEAAGVMTPGFIQVGADGVEEVSRAVLRGSLALPLLGLTFRHKGNARYFYTMEDLASGPATQGLEYFRTFLPGTEYRIHVLRDMVILAQRKELVKDPVEACAENLSKRLNKKCQASPELARVLTKDLRDTKTLRLVLEEVAEDLVASPNQIQRSVNQGWSLVDVPLAEVPDKVKQEAIRVIDALGLDLGAVSVTMDEKDPNSRAAATVVTTGPSLSDEHLQVYGQVIRDFTATSAGREEKTVQHRETEKKVPKELLAKLTSKVADLSEREARRLLKFLEAE